MNSTIPYGSRSTADEVLAGLDLAGWTILVTGCNGGIGLETIRALSSRGAHIIGLARVIESAHAACSELGTKATPMACDLADLASVDAVAGSLLKARRPIDAIITNAGLMGSSQLEKRYGVEMQFLVNHLAHFLLVNRLLPLVPDNEGRIVIVSSSGSVNQAPKEGIQFDNLDGHRSYSAFKFYGQSKLACALYAKELSRRLKGRGIAVNSLHPGAVRGTRLNRRLGFPMSAILAFAQRFFKTPEQGAATQCLLAASPLVQGITGEYWSDCQVATGSRYLNDTVMAQQLWNKSDEILDSQVRCAA
jgi:NAD(P)-dependent dehydrogenase (short-subunit alcohol dehydrogenase family)